MINSHGKDIKEYGVWLEKFIKLAKEKNTKLIWVTTTPYQTRQSGNSTIRQFNKIAVQITKAHKVPLIDLHSCVLRLVKELGAKNVFNADGVHFLEEIRRQQAIFISREIKKILQ